MPIVTGSWLIFIQYDPVIYLTHQQTQATPLPFPLLFLLLHPPISPPNSGWGVMLSVNVVVVVVVVVDSQHNNHLNLNHDKPH